MHPFGNFPDFLSSRINSLVIIQSVSDKLLLLPLSYGNGRLSGFTRSGGFFFFFKTNLLPIPVPFLYMYMQCFFFFTVNPPLFNQGFMLGRIVQDYRKYLKQRRLCRVSAILK